MAFSDFPIVKPFSGSLFTLFDSFFVRNFICFVSDNLFIRILFWLVILFLLFHDFKNVIRVAFQAAVYFLLREFSRLSDHYLVLERLRFKSLFKNQLHSFNCIVDIFFHEWLRILHFFFGFGLLILV